MSTPQQRRRAAKLRARHRVVAAVFAEHPKCAVPWCASYATDPHEPLTRARGGSTTDPANIVPVCRIHHDELHLEPAWAYELGLLRHSWDVA